MDENSNNNSVNSQPNLSNKEIKDLETHEASKKVAHVAGKGLATYYGKDAGAQAYDAISQTKAGQKIEELAGKAFETSPMAKPIARTLDKSGALDAANQAIDMIGSKNAGANNVANNPNINRNMLKGNNASTAKPVNNNFARRNLGNQMQPIVTPPTNIDDSMIPEGVDPEEYLQALNEEQQMMEEMLRQEELAKEKKQKSKERNKKIIEFIKKNPQIIPVVIAISIVLIFLFLIIYMISTDMDIVGTRMTSYSEAKTLGGYCQQIRLIKEHDEYPGDPIHDIDSVDFEETFRLNGKYVKRWEYQDYSLDEYANHIVQAEASLVNDVKTYEVAAILARTYALQIASKKCYTWDNRNKREVYRNPQNFHVGPISEDVQSAVATTSGLVLTVDDKLVDMSNYSYHDYFCFNEKTTEKNDKEHGFYEMLQRTKEENLLIPVRWAKDLDVDNLQYSGKYKGGIYNNLCQENGLSLFGAKYLLNKEMYAYSTIRVLKYYYGYKTEIKRVVSSIASTGCYYWPTTSTRITSDFGLRNAPKEGASTNHKGIDIGVAQGADVYATAAGTVTKAEDGGSYGYVIFIDHGNGIESRYAHLKEGGFKVSVGSTVSQGQVIAESGNTGNSTGPHLHFEMRINGVKVDPLNYVSITDTKPSCTILAAGGSAVNVGDSAKSICLSLKNYGFSSPAIAAIMTNMAHESGLISTNLQNSYEGTYNDLTYTQAVDSGSYKNFGNDSYGYGLVQWTSSGRKQGLYNYAIQTGSSIGDLKMQLDYFVFELQNGYKGVDSALRSSNDASYLATKFCLDFESPANENVKCPQRGASGNVSAYLNFANNNCQ